MLPGMAEPSPVFDPRAVIEGRTPGRTSVAFIAGIVITAACAIIALGADAAQSVAAGDGVVPFLIALPLALLPVPLLDRRWCCSSTASSPSRAPRSPSRSAGAPGSPPCSR